MTININYTYNFEPEVRQQIEESRDWLEKVLASDEFRYKASKYDETEGFLRKVDGFTVNIKRLFPDGDRNRRALYNKETNTISINIPKLQYETRESLAGLLAHEIGHQWYDHEEYDINSFLGYLQYQLKNMEGKSNFWYKFLLWVKSLFNRK